MCKCCEDIDFIIDLNKDAKFKHVLKAGLISYAKRGKSLAGSLMYSSHDLNYCPLCGRKLGE